MTSPALLPDAIQADVDAIDRIPIIASLLEVVCHTTGMGFAAVARVTDEQWVACSVLDKIQFGLKPGGTLELGTTICNEIRQHHRAVVIDHVAEDPEFKDHHTPAQYGFQSYISFPIFRKNGAFFGTLCAIDPAPARLKEPGIMGMFTHFADLIAFHLQTVEDLDRHKELLEQEQDMAAVRERFIAVLGHDLRNPLTALMNGSSLLLEGARSEEDRDLLRMMVRSSRRMADLVENLMDLTRSRNGAGIVVKRGADAPIGPALEQVLAEFRVNWPGRVVNSEVHVRDGVHADAARVAQLFSNILGNALLHGDPSEPVQVNARTDAGRFTLQVTNRGERIPEEAIADLFTPFYRGKEGDHKQGLGLGLYIASEIAHAHDGTLHVSSTNEATCVTFAMPA
ncbi:MAG TPA: GAF domain-containing sensor histidine kinase [Flavobacteriales bacterium]|nr:GAF domain-containing sensor histidine kinase [Flavobacteriales bacterium]